MPVASDTAAVSDIQGNGSLGVTTFSGQNSLPEQYSAVLTPSRTLDELRFAARLCEELIAPVGGFVRLSSRQVGSVANLYCEPGYRIQGRDSLVCKENQAWDYPVPECIRESALSLNMLWRLMGDCVGG